MKTKKYHYEVIELDMFLRKHIIASYPTREEAVKNYPYKTIKKALITSEEYNRRYNNQ